MARKERMVTYLALVREVTAKLKGLSITQISREANIEANQLARLVSSSESDLQRVRVEFLPEPSVSNSDGMEVDPVDTGPSLMDVIMT